MQGVNHIGCVIRIRVEFVPFPSFKSKKTGEKLPAVKQDEAVASLVAQPGFEPGLDGSEPPVLPLDDRAKG